MSNDQDRYVRTNVSTPAVTRALPGILRQVKENSLSILSNQMSDFFNSCDDLFFELANHAGSNSEQNLYFDSMREIRIKKKDVINRFKDNFNAHFTDLVRPNLSQVMTSEQASASFDSLGLVEDDKMEQDVAISSVISKTRQDCQESLYHLNLRFDYLLPDIEINESNNPLDPKQICEAFTQAAALMELDIKARIIVFKQFDRMVARHLNKIYSLANELLINAGILPKVVPSVIKNKQSAPTGSSDTNTLAQENQRAEPATSAEPANQGGHNEFAAAAFTFDQLSNLLAGFKSALGESAADVQAISTSGRNYGRPITQDALLNQLTDLQKQYTDVDAPQTKEHLQTAIYHILQSSGEDGKPSSLTQSDEDVINLVSMFFEFILDDRNLPVPIQALISRLQIPVLKIALKDKNFFNNSKHIARVLINEIASASIGWDDSKKDQQDELYDLINSIVHKVNDEFVGDCAVFERELKRLTDYKQQEAKRASIVETRTNQAAEGKAKTDHTKKTVQSILHQRLNSIELPEFISNFIINQWQKILVLVRLKSGENSQEWLSNLQVVDDLVWVFQVHTDEKSKKRIERLKAPLIEAVEKGLTVANTPEKEKSEIINKLTELLGCLDGDKETLEVERSKLKMEQLAMLGQAPEATGNKSWKEMTALERQQVKQQAIQFENLKKAETLQVGTWFIQQDQNTNRTTRCKLAAYIKPNERFVFVNRYGQKTCEKSKQEVAMELQRQLLKPLESGLLFDRAMSGIVDNLKRVNRSNSQPG